MGKYCCAKSQTQKLLQAAAFSPNSVLPVTGPSVWLQTMLEFLTGLLTGLLTCALLFSAFYFGGIYKHQQKSVEDAKDRKLKAEHPTRHRAKSALGLTSLVEWPTCGGAD